MIDKVYNIWLWVTLSLIILIFGLGICVLSSCSVLIKDEAEIQKVVDDLVEEELKDNAI